MKIGIFDPYLDTLSGGEKYMLSAASCLAQEHEVFIFWDKDKENEIKQAALKKLGIDLSSVKFYQNIFDKKTPLLSRIIQSRKFDAIIYLSDGSIPTVGTKLYIHLQYPIGWVDGKSLKTKLKLFFVRSVFCNSYFTKHFVDRKLNINSRVLYPPITIKDGKNIKKENTILHVGRFYMDNNNSNYKKQDIMIKVFKKMIDSGLKSWEFVIAVGVKNRDGGAFNRFKKMSEGYPIKIIENPSNEELWENYSKAKIYWHATGFGEDLGKYPEKAEHFGISTVEAMGAGCVPVVFSAGGQKEIVENGKNGYLWDTVNDFELKTSELIGNKKLWERMSANAQERADKFTGGRFCRELKEII